MGSSIEQLECMLNFTDSVGKSCGTRSVDLILDFHARVPLIGNNFNRAHMRH